MKIDGTSAHGSSVSDPPNTQERGKKHVRADFEQLLLRIEPAYTQLPQGVALDTGTGAAPAPVQALVQAVLPHTQSAVSTFEVTLSPATLGTLRVTLAVKDSALMLHLQVETPQAERALADNTKSLRQILAAHGLTLRTFTIKTKKDV